MKRVAVYWNLHRKCWSIQSREGADYGRVIAHAQEVSIDRPEYRVNQAGRERVLRECKKNVHAFVVGGLICYRDLEGKVVEGGRAPVRLNAHMTEVYYNPYKVAEFVIKKTGEAIKSSIEAYLSRTKRVYACAF